MTISLQPKEEHEKKDKAKKYKNTRSKLKTLFIVPIWGIDEEYKRKNEDKNEKRGDSSQGVRKGKGKAKKVSFKLSRREGVHRLHKSSMSVLRAPFFPKIHYKIFIVFRTKVSDTDI